MGSYGWPGRHACSASTQQILSRLRIQPVSCRGWLVGGDWFLPTRTLPDAFLYAPWEGSIQVEISGTPMPLETGRILVLPEGVRHAIRYAEGCSRLGVMSIHVRCLDADGSPVAWQPYLHDLPDASAWFDSCRRIASWYEASAAAGGGAMAALVRLLLGRLAEQGLELTPSILPQRVAPALAALRERPELTVTELARQAGLSPERFRRLVRRGTGLGPKAFLDRQRLTLAAELLSTTRVPIAEIATRCGFASLRRLQIRFRAAYGRTPSAWRENPDP